MSTVSRFLGSAGSVSGGIFMWLVGVLANRSGGFAIPFLLLGTRRSKEPREVAVISSQA